MSARKPTNKQESERSSVTKNGIVSGVVSTGGTILPRKRTREEPHNDDSSSDESRNVAAFKDEEDTENLRVQSGPTKRTVLNNNEIAQRLPKQSRKISDEEDLAVKSTASQQLTLALIESQQSTGGYLNEQSLKQHDIECQKKPLNFNYFIKQLIHQEQQDQGLISSQQAAKTSDLDIFKKKPFLNIELLHNRGTEHLLRNKISDKFTRRDIQFYDLYVKKDSGEELSKLKEGQFPLDISANQYYYELEVEDFNLLFWNQQLIEEKFGKSIKVGLTYEQGTMKLSRVVTEDAELVRVRDRSDPSPAKQLRDDMMKADDPDLISLDAQLKQLEKQFGKTSEEIAEIYCRVSGRLNKMKEYLDNKPGVIEWDYLEDLALTRQEDSPEFQVLLQTKGWEEIKVRREFLQATPVMEGNEDEPK